MASEPAVDTAQAAWQAPMTRALEEAEQAGWPGSVSQRLLHVADL